MKPAEVLQKLEQIKNELEALGENTQYSYITIGYDGVNLFLHGEDFRKIFAGKSVSVNSNGYGTFKDEISGVTYSGRVEEVRETRQVVLE